MQKPTKQPMTLALAAAFIALAALHATPAQAGRSCESRPLTADKLAQGLALAQRTSDALNLEYKRSGARVVALARAGQDLSRYKLEYSHMGWAYRTDEGLWRVLHKLNACGTAAASLYRQGLGEFFLDDLWRQDAAWVVPAPALQQPLYALLNDPARAYSLDVKPYSMVSYAWADRYQQSNQWAIETLAIAAEPGVRTRAQAQAWLRFKGYEPTPLRIGALTRLGGRVGSANIAFDDHPNDKRYSDRIETVTVDSVFSWLTAAGLGSPVTLLPKP